MSWMDAKEWCKNFWAQFVAEGNPQNKPECRLTETDWNEVRLRQQIMHNRELSAKLVRLHGSIRSLLCDLVAIDPHDPYVDARLMVVQSAAHKILKEGMRHG